MNPWVSFGVVAAIGLTAAALVVVVTTILIHSTSRHRSWGGLFRSRVKYPYRTLLAVIALWIAADATDPLPAAVASVDHAFRIVTIAVSTWLAVAVVSFSLRMASDRFSHLDKADDLHLRIRTELIVLRRLLSVVIVIVGLASVLLTFPAVQTVGASVLASAGVVSVIAGLAAQSTLGNLFAGIQLAFNGALRVDDVVVIDDDWGHVEEITLTYVVVRVWDGRRLILPSIFFNTHSFENWTRRSSSMTGSVDFDLTWKGDPEAMRAQLAEIVEASPLWDRRSAELLVTSVEKGFLHVRVLVTAADAESLYRLRCQVRERMTSWLLANNPAALPAN